MDIWATRDPYERETDEAERLVRPAPKVKPPRHDRRREEMWSDRDSDVEGDQDLKGDPDLSLNYKTIGGSTRSVLALYRSSRLRQDIVSRYLRQADIVRGEASKDPDARVPVINTETGEHTSVKEDTLKGPDGAKYKPIKHEEESDDGGDTASKVHALAEKHPQLKGMLEILADPQHKEHQTLTSIAGLPITAVEALKGVKFPAGVKTVGDLQAIVQPPKEDSAKPPTKKRPKAPAKKAPEEPAKPDAGADAAKPEPSTEPETKEPAPKPEAKLPAGESEDEEWTSSPGKLHPSQQKELSDWKSGKGPKDEAFQAFADADKTVGKNEKGLLFRTPGTKKKVPFEELPENAQLEWKQRFDQQQKLQSNREALEQAASKDPKLKEVLDALSDPHSDLRKELDESREDASVVEPSKAIPALQGVKLPEGVDSLADLVEATEALHKPKPTNKRKVSPEEKDAMVSKVIDAFPPDTAALLLSKGLHPDDIGSLISDYHMAKARPIRSADIEKYAEKTAKFFQTDPDKVGPPKTWPGKDGKEVAFQELPPEEQAVALEKHSLRTVALSLAARDQIASSLEEKSGAPASLARKLSTFMLTAPSGKDEEARNSHAKAAAEDFFQETLGSGEKQDLPEGTIKKILGSLDPASQRMATAYFQAHDYQAARDRYLDPDSELRISEHDSPDDIFLGIRAAQKFLSGKAKQYPKDTHTFDLGTVFRTRVMKQLRDLEPEKYPVLQQKFDEIDKDDYNIAKNRYDKAVKTHRDKYEQTERKKHDEWLWSHDPHRTPYEPTSFESYLDSKGISEPPKPPRYHLRDDPDELNAESKRMWEDQLKRTAGAGRRSVSVVFRYLTGVKYSSYPGCWTMGASSSVQAATARQGVYWGVAPYPEGREGFAPYEGWQQSQARDLVDKDYSAILSSAREWLKTPVLSAAIDGIVRDTQLRAALDLAIRDHAGGKYSAGFYPTIYDNLLAKLAGVPEKETLLTVRQSAVKSTYGDTRGEVSMNTTAKIRAFAVKVAAFDPELAFDMVAYADKVAGEVPPQFLEHMKGKKDDKDEKKEDEGQKKEAAYQNLRTLVIRTAAAHPEAREAFLPLLQSLKNG